MLIKTTQYILLILLILFGKVCFAENQYSDTDIVQAIWYAEGGSKTNFPYGIKSIPCSGEIECRKICMNSVRNGRKRWIEAGKPDDLIVFISKRYCPISDKRDKGGLNKYWIKNVKFFLQSNQ